MYIDVIINLEPHSATRRKERIFKIAIGVGRFVNVIENRETILRAEINIMD